MLPNTLKQHRGNENCWHFSDILQSNLDNSNLLGNSKKVQVSGSLNLKLEKTGNKKMGWGMNASNMHTSKLDTKYTVLCWTLFF